MTFFANSRRLFEYNNLVLKNCLLHFDVDNYMLTNISIYNYLFQASQLASRLLPADKTKPDFKKKVLFLNAELSLALRQPEEAAKHAANLQPLVDGRLNISGRTDNFMLDTSISYTMTFETNALNSNVEVNK